MDIRKTRILLSSCIKYSVDDGGSFPPRPKDTIRGRRRGPTTTRCSRGRFRNFRCPRIFIFMFAERNMFSFGFIRNRRLVSFTFFPPVPLVAGTVVRLLDSGWQVFGVDSSIDGRGSGGSCTLEGISLIPWPVRSASGSLSTASKCETRL